ncbi:biotin--[acetyl-CoA-carboxylase] ligase [Aquincola tertiaricarbonis]|uniref:biotin--[biotin carboxyl-carrier protein] ligase n=1 Tax=Aquincola tertiaricarbonis TaxID=391953 RepID=A0ABY4SGY2_AQUTE|nr:biotin--[acetyl-CoA-carboxylase] ligase [Aquincola tertiaricarbonis]URI10469.1 biotin--[acetyl-CoA-carboxylase] ligase [Aquincola tertiaricarbonis]
MSNEPNHLPWGAERLWEQLQPLLPGISVEVVARADSTNTQLIDRARAYSGRLDQPVTLPGTLDARSRDDERSPHGRRTGDTQPCLLVAEQQTRGRGRHGRHWQSSAGASLTFSLSLPLAPRDWSGLSLAVGVALAEALDGPAAAPGPRLGLKWPNDLWLMDGPGQGRKLGGVLIETVMVGPRRMAIVGCGLNVLPQSLRELTTGYACLQEREPEITAPAALQRVAVPLAQALLTFEREGFAAFADRFAERDLLRGQPITTTLPELPQGVADGVAADGALRVRVGDGPDAPLHLVSSGDVSVRLR